MSRIKLLLDLVQDVRAVADDLQTIADAMAGDEPYMEETAEKPVPETPAEKEISLEDVRAVLAAKSRDGYGAQVRELLKRHGADRLSQIEPRFYKELLREAEVFGNAT